MKISLRRITLDSGGYNSRGQYYGVGPAVYTVTADGDDVGEIRATNHFESKAAVVKRVKESIKQHGTGRAKYRW